MATERPSSSFSVFKMDSKPLVSRSAMGNVFDQPNEKSSRKGTPIRPSSVVPPLKSKAPPSRPMSVASEIKAGPRFGGISPASFFSRHNPHPTRVRHIKGLNGIPICAVNDFTTLPARLQFGGPLITQGPMIRKHAIPHHLAPLPFNPLHGFQQYPFREKAVPRLGLIPMTETWRDELRELCYKAGLLKQDLPKIPEGQLTQQKPAAQLRKTNYSEDTGRLIPRGSRAGSRASSRGSSSRSSRYGPYAGRSTQGSRSNTRRKKKHIIQYPDVETIVLEMLCQILQTDSVQTVQQWLVSSGDKEKNLVLDIINSTLDTAVKDVQEPIQMIPSKRGFSRDEVHRVYSSLSGPRSPKPPATPIPDPIDDALSKRLDEALSNCASPVLKPHPTAIQVA